MLKDALEFLGRTFGEAKSARKLDLPGDGRKVYVDQAGTLVPLDIPPGNRGHKVDAVDDLIAAAQKWNTSPVVWINGESVVLVTNDADRRDSVTLPLVKSHQFATLIRLVKDPELDQTEMIRLLRIDLAGAAGRAELLAAIRKLKWRTAVSGDANIQHGNESMGKMIENEVTGGGSIPESVLVTCPVYQNHGERDNSFGILCDLEIVASDQAFRFKPIPDEIERVTEAALAGIRDRITEALPEVAIFFGKP